MGTCNNQGTKIKKENTNAEMITGLKQNLIEDELFKEMAEWDGERFKGVGIKRMKGYICNFPINELNKLRDQFWVSKAKQSVIWKTIKQACAMDDVRAENIIKAIGLKPLNGCINELLDNSGKIYRVPNFCINDPYFEKIININNTENVPKMIIIKLYNLYSNNYLSLEVNNTMTGQELKDLYCKSVKLNNNYYITRLIFGGAEIKDDHKLIDHKIQNDYIVQIMMSDKSISLDDPLNNIL